MNGRLLPTSYRADANKRLYLYNGTRPATGSFAIEDDGVALRVLAWAHHKKGSIVGSTGMPPTTTTTKATRGKPTSSKQPQTFGDLDEVDNVLGETGNNYLNGDGVLLYPGTDTGAIRGDSYDVMGPFASLRLKHWRRGIQDVDYLDIVLWRSARHVPPRSSILPDPQSVVGVRGDRRRRI